jgi:hypothetical protein
MLLPISGKKAKDSAAKEPAAKESASKSTGRASAKHRKAG